MTCYSDSPLHRQPGAFLAFNRGGEKKQKDEQKREDTCCASRPPVRRFRKLHQLVKRARAAVLEAAGPEARKGALARGGAVAGVRWWGCRDGVAERFLIGESAKRPWAGERGGGP